MREYGSEHPAILLPDGYFESLNELGNYVTYLRSGREALLYVALNVSQKKDKTVLLPAYCCWSMSAPFEKAGYNVVYYKLNEDLTIDLDFLSEMLEKTQVDAILTMNFFGSAKTYDAITLVKSINPRISVIEDFSHCTFSIKELYNPDVDYYVSSIRKSIGICDGAVIISKYAMDSSLISAADEELSNLRFNAQSQKERYSFSKNQQTKQSFLSDIRTGENLLNSFSTVRSISSRAMSQIMSVNGAEIAYARRENMKHLWSLLEGKVEMVPGLERSFAGAPFSLPILVSDQLKVQHELAQKGVYSQVLWPICDVAQNVCPVAKRMGEHMLSLPIDQRLSWDDVEDIASIVIDVCQKD